MADTEVKFCKDCKWHRLVMPIRPGMMVGCAICSSPQSVVIDLVTGENKCFRECEDHRGNSSKLPKNCGREGKFFEPKE